MSSVVPRTARLQTLFAASSPRDGKGTAGAAEHVLALQLATIAEIGTRIASARTVEAILNVVASEARWLLSFGRCTLALVTTDTQYYRALTLDTAKHGSYRCCWRSRCLISGCSGMLVALRVSGCGAVFRPGRGS